MTFHKRGAPSPLGPVKAAVRIDNLGNYEAESEGEPGALAAMLRYIADEIHPLPSGMSERIGRGIVAVQNGEPEEVVIGMLRGRLAYRGDAVVPAAEV